MKHLVTATLLIGALALTACDKNSRFGQDGGPGGVGDGAMGSVSDPTSPAYFNAVVGDRVLFEVDQSTLTNAGQGVLTQQAAWFGENSEYTAIIEGHADEQGTREYNLALGARRADEARSYLVSKGVPANRLQVVSYGKERPIEVCSDEACYAKNRRAVTVLAGGLTG